MWALQVPALQPLGPLWAPDLPGFGAEPPLEPARRTPQDLADWVAAGIRRRGAAPVAVAGYSMGGTLALLLALRHPDLVSALAVCCSSPCWGRGLRRLAGEVFVGLGRRAAAEVFQWSIRHAFRRHSRDPGQEVDLVDMTSRAHRPTIIALYRALARLDLRAELPRIQVPCLVVGGGRDWLAPPSHLRGLARGLKRSESSLLRGADHLLCAGRPESFSALLAGFLSRHMAPEFGARGDLPCASATSSDST